MKKILVIGCPGSGKSVLSRELNKLLNYPILHLDRVFHIDNETNIGRPALRERIKEFVVDKETFIIDGNYTGTLAFRLQYADTVILYNLNTDLCVKNALSRLSKGKRDDMADGFDNSKMDDDFLEFIRSFNANILPEIRRILYENQYVNVIELNNYDDKKRFLDEVVL